MVPCRNQLWRRNLKYGTARLWLRDLPMHENLAWNIANARATWCMVTPNFPRSILRILDPRLNSTIIRCKKRWLHTRNGGTSRLSSRTALDLHESSQSCLPNPTGLGPLAKARGPVGPNLLYTLLCYLRSNVITYPNGAFWHAALIQPIN
jgi:hypothetical protein